MAAGAWENSGSMAGSDDASQTVSSVWNVSGLVNGLPAVASAPGGLASSELMGLKQNRMIGLTGDGDGTGPSDVTAGGWGSVSASVGKDTGWDRSDSDVNLDMGTKSWESQRPNVTSAVWGQPQDKPSAQWGDIDMIRQKNGFIIRETGESLWDVRPKSWGDIAELPSSQNGNTSVSSPSASSSQAPVGTSSSTSAAAESATTGSVSETGTTDNLPASSMPQALSRDEIIAKAINSNEPWGRTPIRQDVPWVVDDEPTVREPLPSLPKLPTVDPADAQISRIGTGAWEQQRGGAAGAAAGWMGTGRSREDSGSWSISSPDGLSIAAAGPSGVGREFPGGVVGMSAFRPPVERPSSSTGGLLSGFPADRPPTVWGGNLESGGNLWKDKDASGNFAGVAPQSLRRNLSTGNWAGDEQGWNSAGGASAEVEDLINQGRQQNWRSVSRPPTAQSIAQAGFRARPDERGDASMFGVPPPSLQPGFRPGSRAGSQEDVGAAGQWGSLSVKLPNAAAGGGGVGGWGDAVQWPPAGVDATRLKAPPTASLNDDWNSRKQPQTRNRILQQLMDVGFRKEEAQAALINNNMDLRSAIAELMASHNSLDPAARSSTAPVDVRFPPGAPAPAARQPQVLVDQLQQQQQQQRLLSSLGGILSSNLPINATQLQKLMQQQQASESHGRVPVSPESVQAALQQQQMALLQSAHAAVQANLIPPHLIAAVPSLNPTVASKLQRLMQLVDVHQKLGSQAQLPLPGCPADFNAVIKQQILQLRQEVVLALTSSVPPPPLANQAPAALPADLLRASNAQSPEDVAASSRLSQWKQPADSFVKPPAGVPSNGPIPMTAAWPVLPSASSAASDKNAESAALTEGSVTSSLEIEEFVPGKPWQGPSMRSVEDDPYITPGSVTRSAISAIDDAHVMNVLGSKMPLSAAGMRTGTGRQGSSVWSNEADARSATQTPGPHLGRSISWAPGDRTNAPMTSAVNAPTTSLRIRNWPAQTDHGLLKALVERFGALRYFVASPSGDQIFVSFVHVEDAVQAHRALATSAPGGLPPLVMEFISDADFQAGVMTAGYTSSQQPDSGWQSSLGTVFGGGAAGSVWSSGGTVEDHSSFLPSDLFSGGQ